MVWLLSLKLSTKYASLQKIYFMKPLPLLVICFFCFVFTGIGQNVGNQFIQPGQAGYSPGPRTREAGEPEPPDVNILSQERADMYQELLGIDSFQKEVLKTFLKGYYTKSSAIAFDENLKFDQKQQQINLEKKNLEKNLLDVFPQAQVQAILDEEQFGSKTKEYKKEKRKEKKRKKKKDNR